LAGVAARVKPGGMSPMLNALWLDGTGDWEGAHQIAQSWSNEQGAHLHAYLHRKQGDISNADYWYHRAGIARPASLEEEWKSMVTEAMPG